MFRRSLVLAFALATAGLIARPAGANVLVTVDKSTQQMSVQVDGVLRWQWRVSTGRPGYDTPSGTFRAFRMEAEHFSKEFDDAPMPHSIFFTKIGHAIHGYLDTRNLGSPASHGCVRLDPANATRLFALVEREGVLNTTVVITGSASAAVARRRGETSFEQTAEPAFASPSYRSYNRSYGYSSSDERYAPLQIYRERDDGGSGYPPAPPPNYPPFPRAWR